jgi:hypothetical protein
MNGWVGGWMGGRTDRITQGDLKRLRSMIREIYSSVTLVYSVLQVNVLVRWLSIVINKNV